MANRVAALAAILLPALATAAPRADRGAIHGTVRWWEGTTNSWREVTVEAVWKRPQFPAFEERSPRVGPDADTFCGAEGKIRYRSHSYSPGNRARPDELRDARKREEARRRLMQTDAEYEVPVRFDDDAVELCVMISKADHRVLGRIRIDRKTGYFAVERPWFNTGNNSIPWAEIRTRELNALGEPMQSERKGSTSLFAGWFFDLGKMGPAGGSGRWQEEGEPEEEGAERPKRIVEWSLRPGVPSAATVELAGCAALPVGKTATLQARASPTGGKYRWTASTDAVVLAPLGGAAALSCEAPGHATVKVAYEAPDGTTREASTEATCFALRGFGGGGEPLEVPLHDEVGNGVPPVAVKLDLSPPDAVDALRFEVAHPPLASAVPRTGALDVQGVREGTTSVVARTCAWESPSLPVKVVPCARALVERLRWEQELARRRGETARRRMSEALSGKEFNTASSRIDQDVRETANTLKDVLLSSLVAVNGTEATKVAMALEKATKAVAAATRGDFSKGGRMAVELAIKDLIAGSARAKAAFEAAKIVEKMAKAQEAANQLAGDLGTLYGAAEESQQADADADKADAEVLRIGEKLRRCREAPEQPQPAPKPPQPSPDPPRSRDRKRSGGGEPAPTPTPPPVAPERSAPPEEPPPPPPELPAREFRPGLPIACECPERRTVTWTIGGRKVEVGTVELGGTLGCAQDLASSVANAGEAIGALTSATEGLEGIGGKSLEEQHDVLQEATVLLGRAGAGVEAFRKETDGLAAKLDACRKPIAEAGATLRKTAATVDAIAPPP